MKSFILVFLFLLTLTFTHAQSQFPLTYHLVVGGGKSHLQSNQDTIPKFSSLEFRLGLELQKPFNNRFEIVTRLAFGFKCKIQPDPAYHPIRTMPRMRLEAITATSHGFVEMPILLQYNVAGTPLSLRGGGNFRVLLTEQYYLNYLSYDKIFDFGLIAGANANLSKKFNIGIEYCYGLSNVIDTTYKLSGTTYRVYAKNAFLQIYLNLQLKRKSKQL